MLSGSSRARLGAAVRATATSGAEAPVAPKLLATIGPKHTISPKSATGATLKTVSAGPRRYFSDRSPKTVRASVTVTAAG